MMLGVKPTELCTCKDELKEKKLSSQLQIQSNSLMGESKYERHGEMMDPKGEQLGCCVPAYVVLRENLQEKELF